MSIKFERKVPPRFVFEGYEVRESGKEIIGYGVTGVKPDAPQWAHDEFEEWLVKVRESKKSEKRVVFE